MGGRQIVLVSTAGFFFLNRGIFGREAKTKRLFSQCDEAIVVIHAICHEILHRTKEIETARILPSSLVLIVLCCWPSCTVHAAQYLSN
jgi:hypothetical protein